MRGRGGPLPWLTILLSLSCGHAEKAKPTDVAETTSQSPSAACTDYCDTVMSACVGENVVYVTNAACLSVCALLEPGDPEEPSGNTVACRKLSAIRAEREPDENCSSAGPGGNGTCGGDCEAYCALYSQVCPDEADAQGIESCAEQCGALVDQTGFDVIADHQGDTLECRLVHLTSASLKPAEHCQHAQLAPTAPWCVPDL